MPHIIIEHSKGVSEALDIQKLLGKLHDAAMALPSLPVGGIRTRAHSVKKYHVGDGKPGREFIYIIIRIGRGRSDQVKREIGDTLFTNLTDFTDDYFNAANPLSLGLEIQEIEKEMTWKKNNIHQILKDQ